MKRSGFTIIENLVSVLLMGIVLTGGMAFFSNAYHMTRMATNKKIVMQMLNSKIEQLIRAGYPNLPSTATPEVLSVVAGRVAVTQTVTVTDIDDPVGGPIDDYKKIEVKGVWSEAGKSSSREAKLVTYLAP